MGKIADHIADERATLKAHHSNLERIIATFEAVFGEHRIRWELMDFTEAVGIGIEKEVSDEPYLYRVAFTFGRRTSGTEHVQAALRWALNWDEDPTKHPETVKGDDTLSGHEINVANITFLKVA